MSIQDYKNATAKLREFSEFYEENRYKTFGEILYEAINHRIGRMCGNIIWFGGYRCRHNFIKT